MTGEQNAMVAGFSVSGLLRKYLGVESSLTYFGSSLARVLTLAHKDCAPEYFDGSMR